MNQSFAPNTQRDYRRYARHYSSVLTNGDASPLLPLSDCKRRHAMEALAALANFSGAKERWRIIVSEYDLKWAGRNDLGELVGLLYSKYLQSILQQTKLSRGIGEGSRMPTRASQTLLKWCEIPLWGYPNPRVSHSPPTPRFLKA